MPSYFLETYMSRARAGDLGKAAARAREVALRLEADGRRIRFVRSTFVPSDEVALLMFEAESADAVDEVASLAAIPYERIVEAVE